MYHEFNCNDCGTKLRIKAEKIGALTKCPSCDATQVAPAATTDEVLPATPLPPQQNPFADPPNPHRPVGEVPNQHPSPFQHSSYHQLMTEHALAPVSSRLAGWIIDYVLFAAFWVPGLLATSILDQFDPGLADLVGGLLMVVLLLGGMGFQWYLISTTGQSIGKMFVGTRIVTPYGSPPGFLSGVVLRQWVFSVLSPCYPLAAVVYFVDGLFVFSQRRQCLHDVVATTYVLDGAPPKER